MRQISRTETFIGGLVIGVLMMFTWMIGIIIQDYVLLILLVGLAIAILIFAILGFQEGVKER